MCICLWPEFDCPEVTLCGWQDIKIQLLLLLLLIAGCSVKACRLTENTSTKGGRHDDDVVVWWARSSPDLSRSLPGVCASLLTFDTDTIFTIRARASSAFWIISCTCKRCKIQIPPIVNNNIAIIIIHNFSIALFPDERVQRAYLHDVHVIYKYDFFFF